MKDRTNDERLAVMLKFPRIAFLSLSWKTTPKCLVWMCPSDEHLDQSIDKEDSWSDLIEESDETTQSDDSTQEVEDVAASESGSVK